MNPVAQVVAGTLATVEPSLTERFLRTVAGNSLVTIQTFDDTEAKRKNLLRILQGYTAANERRLRSLNEGGAGVFFMVNQGDGRGRKAGNVQRVRSLFVDLDGAPVEPVLNAPLKPHIVVESSPGRFHAYWLVDDIALSEFGTFQNQLAERFEGDPSVKDLPRVMRVPGYLHQKSTPYMSNVIRLDDGRFDRESFIRAFDLDERRTIVRIRPFVDGKVTKGSRNHELYARSRGFVNKGLMPDQVQERMQAYNAEHCDPPLCATEVDDIVARACADPAKGSFALPFAFCDSPEFRAMSNYDFRVAVYAQRRGQNGAEISLPWTDVRDVFKGNKRFYRARKNVESKVLDVVRESVNSGKGKSTPTFRLKKS